MLNRRRLLLLVLMLGSLAPLAVALRAQVPLFPPRTAIIVGEGPKHRGSFSFCRLVYSRVRNEPGGSGWNTDYPTADQNLMIRFEEFTSAESVRFDDGSPAHVLVRASDEAVYECPFLFASDVGTAGFSPEEAEGLRNYLLKGGFLWVDDFWGIRALEHWLQQMERVLPGATPFELTPEHPLYSTFYTVRELPQIPNIAFWRRTGGQTSERGPESATPRMYGLSDPAGRLVVLMTHNTDIADAWEREGEDYEFFHSFSPYGYAVGINVLIWSMTH
jgi:hypothetical protein